MKPVNKTLAYSVPTSSECIVWRGDNISCLGIYKGDFVSDIVYKVTEELCSIINSNDLASLTVDKLYSLCNGKRIEKSLVPILQLMADNNLCFKDTIDQILIKIGLLESGNPFLLNTSCLGKNINTIEETLQQIINNICSFKTSIININTTIEGLQTQIDAIISPELLENIISTCLLSGKKISEQTIFAALEACSLNTDLGVWEGPNNTLDALAVIYAIGSPTVVGCVSTYPNGWIVKTSCDYTIADVVNNLAIAIYEQENRVTTIEEDCCTSKCEDILYGFSVITNEEQTAIILRFRSSDGFSLPTDFTDCGSKVIVTDEKGETEEFDIAIENGLISDDLDLSNLFLEKPVTIAINTKFCSSSYICTQCMTVVYDLQLDGCPVCLIESEGTGNITIVYDLI